jgi:hypothetical protein
MLEGDSQRFRYYHLELALVAETQTHSSIFLYELKIPHTSGISHNGFNLSLSLSLSLSLTIVE